MALLGVNFNHALNVDLLVVCNKLMSSFWLMLSYGFWHFHHPYFASLFGVVHCLLLKMRVVHTSPVHPKPISLYIFLKTATISIYHSISIAVPRYIAMQLPSYITWPVVIHHYTLLCMILLLDHCISCYTGRGIQFYTSCFISIWVICTKKCVVILECCP